MGTKVKKTEAQSDIQKKEMSCLKYLFSQRDFEGILGLRFASSDYQVKRDIKFCAVQGGVKLECKFTTDIDLFPHKGINPSFVETLDP